MTTNAPGGGHNDRVTPRPARTLTAALAALALLVGGLLLAGCGTGGDGEDKKSGEAKASSSPSVSLPTGNVEVPDGVTLTKAGTELGFGQAAVVAYEPNTQRSSVLSMSRRLRADRPDRRLRGVPARRPHQGLAPLLRPGHA